MPNTPDASVDSPRLLIIGAHPDDAEYHAGGLAEHLSSAWALREMVSVTDGGAGHFRRGADELIAARREESVAAGKIIDAEYESLGFPDGQLLPSVEVRHSIIRGDPASSDPTWFSLTGLATIIPITALRGRLSKMLLTWLRFRSFCHNSHRFIVRQSSRT